MLLPGAPRECGFESPAWIDADGFVHLPAAPGLGASPDRTRTDALRSS